jgi:hypothetical protein
MEQIINKININDENCINCTDNCTKCGEDRKVTGFVKKRKICKKCCNEISRLYKQNNKQKISEYNKKYKSDNKEDISTYNKTYNSENRESIQKRQTVYLKNKRHSDPQYKLSTSLRTRIGKVINGQNKKQTLELLGCSYKFLMSWLTYQFKPDMNFENHGTVWHIDHIIPCKKFDLQNEDNKLMCFNWSNLQPLYVKDNLSKRATVIKKELVNNEINITKFLKNIKNEKYTIYKFDKMKYLNL